MLYQLSYTPRAAGEVATALPPRKLEDSPDQR